ncbi:MAG TPA: 3-hydroxyacyl-CoA dehydrogenase NAD-binding domain-containing protein [Steroidobacteraceae bacterium]|nr:3-hydroxyacyl-CoA dehydrogenase NAD-binding domain-containing protein [Steroidobacteraceae bacterium]
MSLPVSIEHDGEVGVIVIDHPPVNALARVVRQGLLDAIETLDGEPSVRAIVLHGRGKAFMAGADMRELDDPPLSPRLTDVLMRLESCAKPVIAALHGAVLGGGAEAALAAHYRCATHDLNFGFPEVKLGLLPGAGGTARLPRLVGVPEALDLMLGGEPLDAQRALALGLIDRLIAGEPRAAGLEYARELINGGAGPRRARERGIADRDSADAALFARYRARLPKHARGTLSAEAILESVAVALEQPLEPAVEFAQERFQRCRTSIPSRALRHLFWAERPATPAPEDARPVRSVAILGAGTMGSGIAASFAQAGFEVLLIEPEQRMREAARGRIRSIVEGSVKRGRLTPQAAELAQSRIQSACDLASVGGADVIVEAVFEDRTLKERVFADLGQVCKPGALLATNTSTLDVGALARAAGRPADVVGMHFFSPAHIMRLVEIVGTPQSSPQALATALAVSQRLGKIGVVVGNAFGFVGNRMLYHYGREKELMLLEGATPEHIDAALEEFGMAMGPNAVGDLAGLDVGVKARAQWAERPTDPRFFRISELLVAEGRLGQKCGRGFYRYLGAEQRRVSDPEVIELIRREAQRLGIAQRQISSAEIVERCMLALINGGARLLEQGIARSAADIDVIWCNGYGFPRTRGGPMFHADTLGLESVVQATERYRAQLADPEWRVPPLIASLARSGGRLSQWRAGAQA